MSNIDSPAVARRRVRLALRTARQARRLTQTQIAKAMDWSLSKVMRIEKGEVNVSPSDLRVLLDHLEVRDPDRVRQLLEDARLSRQERWTIDAADREHFTPAMLELFQFEAEATTIRYFNNQVIPGMLQTRAYAEAIFDDIRGVMEDEVIEARIAIRQLRLHQILYRRDAPSFLVVLDESVLLRPLGGRQVMADQLNQVLKIMLETPLVVRILPFVAAAGSTYFYGSFALHDLGEAHSALLYRENVETDAIIHAPAEIAKHRAVFEGMWSRSLDGRASARRIEAAAKEMGQARGTPQG